ncbi:MAG: RNA methyltransferase [Opitutaceae bacterium]|nr:RNA methyltransferase [Opitutaceae bacterium]|tara:strand:- start:215 stop:571 length:357 start_codon:yes stop_codon:yes gene_type:complete
MAFDEELAARVRRYFQRKEVAFDEKRMMGGLCFMVDEKMCLGVSEDRLMVRLDSTDVVKLVDRPGAAPMDFTDRPMKGFFWVYKEGISTSKDLTFWIEKALAFNLFAKASKKKKKPSK